MYDVFLSHNRKQKPWVRRLARVLRAQGLHVFFDEEDIAPGEQIIPAIDRGIEHSRHVVLVLSDSSLASPWVGMEASIAAHREIEQPTHTLVPIQLEAIDERKIPGYIRSKNKINLCGVSTREKELRRLFRHLNIKTSDSIPVWDFKSLLSLEGDEQSTELFVADASNLSEWNWNSKILLDRLLEIDYELMENLTQTNAGSTPQWSPILVDNPNTWRILVDYNQVIGGYWHFTPLFPEEYAMALRGQLIDSEITGRNVAPIDSLPGLYDGYVVAVCMRPKYRNARNMQLLFGSFLDALQSSARNGAFIRELTANAYTDSGIALCRALRMKRLCDHIDRGEVYHAPIATIIGHPLSVKFPELVRLYREAGLADVDTKVIGTQHQ